MNMIGDSSRSLSHIGKTSILILLYDVGDYEFFVEMVSTTRHRLCRTSFP